MDKQYSVKFFSSFLEALQKVCRDFLDFDDSIELSGYLSLEIDNVKKERYVLSEMLNSSGNLISESYCTKAFKTVRKYQPTGRENISPRSSAVINRSQRESHDYLSDSHTSTSPMYKNNSSDSRNSSKNWHNSSNYNSGYQSGDSGSRMLNQKRNQSSHLDDPPSNKRGRVDSLLDEKPFIDPVMVSQLDPDTSEASYINTSQSFHNEPSSSHSTDFTQRTSSSYGTTSSHTPGQTSAIDSIRMPIIVKNEPEPEIVDIDLSEMDSMDSVGGSDSGSMFPSMEGPSGSGAGNYRSPSMGGAANSSDTYQNVMAVDRRSRSVAMHMALRAVEQGLLTVSAAARLFKVTQQALHHHVKKHGLLPMVKRGYQRTLTQSELSALEQISSSVIPPDGVNS